MVAHDARTGQATRPTELDEDFKPVRDPQINIQADVDDSRKPAATLTGYVRGGTTNPSEGDDGSVKYFDENGKEVDAAQVLTADVDEGASSVSKTEAGKRRATSTALQAHNAKLDRESNSGKSAKDGK